MTRKKTKESQAAAQKTALISAIVNIALATIKCSLGVLSNSSALIADGIHSIADLASDAFTYVILKIAHNDADETHPYGHGKFETFGTLIMAVLLVFTALGIAWSAVDKFLGQESALTMGAFALAAAAISIVGNELLFHYCRRIGEAVNSKIVIANAWHHRSDSLSSVAALIGVGLTIAGYPLADTLAAIFVAIVLLKTAWEIGFGAFNDLVDGAITDDLQNEMKEILKHTTGVTQLLDLRARKAGGQIFADVKICVPPRISVSEGHAIAEEVEHRLIHKIPHLAEVFVHVDAPEGKHAAHPVLPKRKKLEELIIQTLATHLPQAKFKGLLLHFSLDELEGDIILNSPEPLPSKALADVKTALSTPKGPFAKTVIYQEH